MKKASKRIATLLNLALLLALAFTVPAPAIGQASETAKEPPPAAAAPQAPASSQTRAAPVATPAPIDCNKPLPGRTTTLAVDDEIMVAYGDQELETHIAKYDNTSNTDASLKHFWNWRPDDHDEFDLYQPRSVAITTADLDLDGKAEVVTAIGNNNPGQLEVVSLKNPEASSGIQYDLWTSSSHDREGDNMGYLMAAAAGDLDATYGGDASEEVVVAFSDEEQYLQLVLLDGESDGGITYMGYWRSSSHSRYNVDDIAVDVGDLDGDGYKDEIAVALADGGSTLQVIVLEYNGSGGLTELAYGRYDSASTIGVTTGVFSGDGKDQIAVGFADGYSWQLFLNVELFEYESDTKSIKKLSHWSNSDSYRDSLDDLSVASGDIDGDRWDEIFVAFADRDDRFQAVTLDADTGHLKFHSSVWGIDAATDISYVGVGAGDIDGDGRAEIVSSFSDYDSLLQMLSFDDKSSCPCSDNGEGLHLRDQRQENWDARFTYLAMGDVDGNNLYADYTGQCEQTDETRLISMVNRPPYWQAYNPATDVAYASSIKGGDVTEDHITNSYGSSVTFQQGFDFGGFELGTSFTSGWNHSITHSSASGSSLETRAGWTSPNDGLVTLNTVTYYTYQYKKRDGSGLARVSVPVNTQTDSKKMSYWNQSGGAQSLFPDSWVPAYRTGWMTEELVVYTDGTGAWAGSDYGEINGQLERVSAWIEGSYINTQIDSWGTELGGPQISGDAAGLGIALTELNGNHKPEVVVAWVENPTGDNSAYYSVGWDYPGDPTTWSVKKQIPGWVGGSTQGAALDIYDLNGNKHPDILFGWIDNPGGTNHGYYRVGWDLDPNGDSSNWWPHPKPIEGAFGVGNGGLGLTVTDADGDGALDLVAAWGREAEEAGKWALGYSIGRNLQGTAFVDSWVPGHPIPGAVDHEILGATVASADLVAGSGHPELVVGWIENTGNRPAYKRVGTCQQLGGEVDQRPTDIDDPVAKDGQFKIKLYDKWWVTNGDLQFRWDKTGHDPIYISLGGGDPYWKVEKDTFTQQTVATSESYNYAVGGETKFLGFELHGAKTWGFEKGHSYSVSWEKGFFMDGTNVGLDPDKQPPPTTAQEYKYNNFTYMQEVKSHTGMKQAYMVLDYFVPWRGSDTGAASTASLVESTAPLVTPGLPIVDSPTHPDPGAWYAADTATFTWRQPDGDPAVVDGYRWYVDRSADTIPSAVNLGLTDTATYEGLSDGLWYLHLRARDESGQWSETAHRAFRVDAQPPQVELALDPPHPAPGADWYNVPLTAGVSADDGAGSGLAGIETSTNGATWQPYAGPLLFDVDTPSTTLWARATDLVGNVSEPVSTTFSLDLTLPTSVEAPGCWQPGGDCKAEMITDAAGNQRLHLSGPVDGSLSGERSLGIQINGDRWTAADEVGDGQWSFTSDTEVGAGCHIFHIQSEDRAGNVEDLHRFGGEVVWHPRTRPDLSGSWLSAVPSQVRPGDTVALTLVVPSSGPQETWVPISAALPAGLNILPGTISGGGAYDDATRTITWPPRYLWPGQQRRMTFDARVDAGLGATSLDVTLTALGTWPIVDTCPADALPGFRDLETTVERTATISVDPTLPDGADTRPPEPAFLRIEAGAATNGRQVGLRVNAGSDAHWLYLREWTLGADGTWTVVQESGWRPFSPSPSWNLSPGDGVQYLGAWLADKAGNVSILDTRSLASTNLLEGNQSLSDGQRIQYRFPLRPGELAIFNLLTRAGNADLYAWQPASGWRPDYASTGAGLVDTVAFYAARGGQHLVEAKAEGDSQYELHLAGDVDPKAADSRSVLAGGTPEHPLAVSDPLSAGAAVPPAPPEWQKLYLPFASKGR
jgi:hypothetical protein